MYDHCMHVFQVTGSEFSEKQSTRATVEGLASSLKSQVAPSLASSIDERMEELTEKWKRLEDKLTQRKTGEGNKRFYVLLSLSKN